MDPDLLQGCLDIISQNICLLSDLSCMEDELVPGLWLCHLYDIAEDVAMSSRLGRAEAGLMGRRY